MIVSQKDGKTLTLGKNLRGEKEEDDG